MNKKENQTKSAADKAMTDGKAPYSPPRLIIYGDIRELTLTVGTMGALDTDTLNIPANRTS
jgi:hypothetical protein